MKRNLFSLLTLTIILFSVFNSQAQTILPCGFTPTFDSILHSDSVQFSFTQQRFANARAAIASSNHSLVVPPTDTLFIPVVVHVLHDPSEAVGQGLNISYAQILSQIDRLNADFANDTAFIQLPSGQWAVNTNIRFCLARIPMGPMSWTDTLEPGVMRYAANPTTLNHINDFPNTTGAQQLLSVTHPSGTEFPFQNYLNIWTVNSINFPTGQQVAGYSPIPVGQVYNFPLDGIVMDAHMFGDNTVGSNNFPIIYPQYNSGNICAHEAGHYLGLLHPFTGGCSGMTNADCATNGDLICDTPPTSHTSSSCVAGDSCAENITPFGNRPDMVENYMMWTDDNCLNTFTSDQADAMQGYILSGRSMLCSSYNLGLTGVASPSGCLPPVLIAVISYPSPVCQNDTIAFGTPTGSGFSAVAWNWSFAGGTPSTSTVSSPAVSFAMSGQHQIILTAYSAAGDSISDTLYLYVSPCAALQSSQGVWYFGKQAGVSFATGTAVHDDQAAINNTIRAQEGVVSVCDSMGSLVFYSDGDTVWNRNHQVAIVGLAATAESKAQILTVPHPSVPNWYYLFHGSAHEDAPSPVIYSIIRDTLNTMQAVALNVAVPLSPGSTTSSEGITAIPHCNGRDWWIIMTTTDSGWQSPVNRQLLTYLLSPAGLTDTSGLSPFPVITQTTQSCAFWGQLKASPKGNRIVRSGCGSGLVYDFDPLTGLISNERILNFTISGGTYSCSFSPDGNSVYFDVMMASGGIQAFDLTQTNPTAVVIDQNSNYVDFQIGPDSALYITHNTTTVLDRIGNPNNILSPNYVVGAVPLNPVNAQIRAEEGLPNMIDALPPPVSSIGFTVTYNTCTQVAFSALGCWNYYDFNWNFGDATSSSQQNPTHNYAATGTYTVTLTLSIGTYSTSVQQVINIINTPPTITGPYTVCTGTINPSTYSVPAGYTSYLWTVTGGGTIVSVNNQSSVDVSWTGSGTITCQINNGPNCQLTITQGISVNPAPTANAGPDQQVCSTGMALLSGSASGGTAPYFYSWTPSATVTNPNAASTTASVAATTTFILTVTDANGCAATDYSIITLDTTLVPPTVVFSSIPQLCDNAGSINLLPYVSPGGGSFSGTGVAGNTFDPSLANAPDTNALLYFYTDPSTGCTGLDSSSVYVYNCCTVATGINTTNGQTSSTYGAQFNSTPTAVRINGTFYVNNTFFISGYNGANTVYCASNATIVIKSGARLVIQSGSTLAACDQMWNGIIIEPGGQLEILTNSLVRDAKQAVVSKDGAKFTLDRALLRDNYQNVIVEPHTGQGLHPGTIVRSGIVGTTLSLSPYAGVKTFSGMEVTDVDSLYVGVATTTTDENEFKGMDIGILTTNSNVYIRNNQFSNITSTQVIALPSCCLIGDCGPNVNCNPAPKGTAIWATGADLSVGGPTVAYQNRFTTCTRGILAEDTINADIQNNKFQSITSSNTLIQSYCIQVRTCYANTEVISNNTIYSCLNGIMFGFSGQTYATIESNDLDKMKGTSIQVSQTTECPVSIGFNTINATATANGKYGIRVANAVVTNTTPYIEVHGNITKMLEKHIWVTNFPYIVVDSSNNMQFVNGVPTTTQYGIQVQNSHDALVDGNTVTKNGAVPTDTNYRKRLYGISMETNCYNTQVSNNGLFKVGTGVQYFNANNYPSSISCNNFFNDMRGILFTNTYIGDQGAPVSVSNPNGIAQDNQWTITGTQAALYKSLWAVNSPTCTLYYRSSASTYFPPLSTHHPFTGYFTFTGPLSNAPSSCVQPCPTCRTQSDLAALVDGEVINDSTGEASKFITDQSVYAQLQQNDSLMMMGTEYDSVLVNFFMEKAGENVGQINAAYTMASAGDMSGAAAAKDGITPSGNPDMNHKIVLEIYLRSWAIGQLEFTPDDSAALYAVAYQNVMDGGTAVYDARVMLDLDIDDLHSGSGARLAADSTQSIPAGYLYPNPTAGIAIYEITLGEYESGHVVITDIFGRSLLQQPLKPGFNQAELNLSELPSGIYLYKAVINDEVRQTGKVVIDK